MKIDPVKAELIARERQLKVDWENYRIKVSNAQRVRAAMIARHNKQKLDKSRHTVY